MICPVCKKNINTMIVRTTLIEKEIKDIVGIKLARSIYKTPELIAKKSSYFCPKCRIKLKYVKERWYRNEI